MTTAVKVLVSALVVVSLAAAVYTSSTGSKVCFNFGDAEAILYFDAHLLTSAPLFVNTVE
jgi:hypothetical protein